MIKNPLWLTDHIIRLFIQDKGVGIVNRYLVGVVNNFRLFIFNWQCYTLDLSLRCNHNKSSQSSDNACLPKLFLN